MKILLYKSVFLVLLIVSAVILPARAQHEGFIYGEITLVNNEQYTGQIFWSAGQRMWVDMLTVEKKDNPVLKYLNNEQLEKLSQEEKQKQMDWGFMDLWQNHYPSRKHELRCRFGDIAVLQVSGSKDAVIILKNGKKINVYINDDPEYKNQLGRNIKIYTSRKEKLGFEWDKIAKIRFMQTPTKLAHLHAEPLYGTVLTRSGFTYTGLIRWDMDEYLTTNWVDGKSEDDKNLKVRFRDVQSIRPKGEGALVKLLSGKEIYLQDNSNVSRKNHGIVVRHPTWGQVIIRWRDFKEANFSPYPANPEFGYDAFPKPKSLRGSVRTKDHKIWKGPLIFDLDEKLDIETLDGWDRAGALRQVPFRYIKEVSPINQTHSTIMLTDGEKLVLGDRSDVSEDNWGMFLWPQQGKYKYIPWNKVDRVTIE